MAPLNMKKGVEGFDVSKTTSVMKNTRLNIAHNDDMNFFTEKVKRNGGMSAGESPGSDSPAYEDFVEFDPSTFRLTPQSTISPKRDAGLMSEFKSVDSYDSLVLLSVGESADDLRLYKVDEDELVVENDSNDGEVLPLVQDVMVPVDDDDPQTNVTLVEDFSPSNSDDVEMVDVSLVDEEMNAGNVSFDLTSSKRSNQEYVEHYQREVDQYKLYADNTTNEDTFGREARDFRENREGLGRGRPNEDRDREYNKDEGEGQVDKQRDSLDSSRLMNYLKNDKVNEICKRLKADLKGTREYSYEELPLTDQVPFSERVYNYISELKAYSSISSQDRTTSSRLTSLDLKTLQSLDTIDTIDTDERVKDFEQVLESGEEQNEMSKMTVMMDNYKRFGSMEVSSEEMQVDEDLVKVDRLENNLEQDVNQLERDRLSEEQEEERNVRMNDYLDLKVDTPVSQGTSYSKEGYYVVSDSSRKLQEVKVDTGLEVDMETDLDVVKQRDFDNEERNKWVEQSKVGKENKELSFEMGLKSLEYATQHEYSYEDDEVYQSAQEDLEVAKVEGENLDKGERGEVDNKDKEVEVDMEMEVEREMSERVSDVNRDLDMRMNEFNQNYMEEVAVDLKYTTENEQEELGGDSRYRVDVVKLNKEDIEERVVKEVNKNLEKQVDMEPENKWKTELVKGSTTDSLNHVDDKWYGLECMASSYGVNLVYSCLRSIKIQVGDNLHEYDAYGGTKMMMNKFLELMKKLNGLEKKLRGDFLSLEKNDYTLEATRNSYVSLAKSNSRLEGLLEYYKEYEKLQKDSIKLKSENIGLVRREILNKLNEFQSVSKLVENSEGMVTIENRLSELYDSTGFFVLPLYHNSQGSNYNFMYLFNFNYYSVFGNFSRENRNGSRTGVENKSGYYNNTNYSYNYNNDNNNNYSNNSKERYNNRDKYLRDTFSREDRNNKDSYVGTNFYSKYQYQSNIGYYNSNENRYYCLEAVTPQMLEKLKVLEYLPYKPRKVTPDLELKLFVYFQSDSVNSTLSGSSNDKCFVTSNPLSSGSGCSSNLPYLDFLNDNKNSFNHREYNGENYLRDMNGVGSRSRDKKENENGYGNNSNLMEVNLDVDVNMLVDLYSVRNDMKLVLYSPFHKDTPYYRFKLDLVDCFNHLLSLKMSGYVDELTENLQLAELLEVLVQFTNELNLKFVYYLKLFNDLLKLSSNHYYLSYDRSSLKHIDKERVDKNNMNNSNNDLNDFNNYNNCTNFNYNGNNMNYNTNNYNNSKEGYNNRDKVLKLMLTFKNNMPCLWCNVYFNFDYRKDKNKNLHYFNKELKDGLIHGVKFEFVHKLNKSYYETYESTLKVLNESVNGPNKANGLVEHIITTLNTYQYYM